MKFIKPRKVSLPHRRLQRHGPKLLAEILWQPGLRTLRSRTQEQLRRKRGIGRIRSLCGVLTHSTCKCRRCGKGVDGDQQVDTVLRLQLLGEDAKTNLTARMQEEQKIAEIPQLIVAGQAPQMIDDYQCDLCNAARCQGRSAADRCTGVVAETKDLLFLVLDRFLNIVEPELSGVTRPRSARTLKVRRRVKVMTTLTLRDMEYNLYGVVSHRGAGLSHGHYVASIRGQDEDWYLCDDHVVQHIGASAQFDVESGQEPSILFYHRVAAPLTSAPSDATTALRGETSVPNVVSDNAIASFLAAAGDGACITDAHRFIGLAEGHVDYAVQLFKSRDTAQASFVEDV